jgi:hypothetical protein
MLSAGFRTFQFTVDVRHTDYHLRRMLSQYIDDGATTACEGGQSQY